MRQALRLAWRGYGTTSPNPMVGAVLVKGGRILGRGWHRKAGLPHAEIEALRNAERRGLSAKGATLYVTLEPCCTHGRTPPCTEAIMAAGIKRVVVGATDPNPGHAGRAFDILRQAGIEVVAGVLADECTRLNEAFNHWIVHRTPFVIVKAAMTLDGKIATAAGESRWITGEKARAYGMKLRQGADAVLVGIHTVLADDPALTVRSRKAGDGRQKAEKRLRRIVLDSMARTPLTSRVVSGEHAAWTTIVVGTDAPVQRVARLARQARVLVSPPAPSSLLPRPSPVDLRWLLQRLGEEEVTCLLVEGGGEVNASFLAQRLAHRVAFFYAPKILGGRDARRAVAGEGAAGWKDIVRLEDMQWRRLGEDMLLKARVSASSAPQPR